MGKGCVVEDEIVRGGCADEVDDRTKDTGSRQCILMGTCKAGLSSPGDQVQAQGLSVEGVSGPGALIGILRWF